MIFEYPPQAAENRRSEIRLPFSKPQKAWIRFVSAAGKKVDLGPGRIELLNLSPGGCGFRSGLCFPASDIFLMKVYWETEKERLELPGHIRWRLREENGFRYGMRLVLGKGEKLRLQCLLNETILTLYPGKSKIHQMYRKVSNFKLT